MSMGWDSFFGTRVRQDIPVPRKFVSNSFVPPIAVPVADFRFCEIEIFLLPHFFTNLIELVEMSNQLHTTYPRKGLQNQKYLKGKKGQSLFNEALQIRDTEIKILVDSKIDFALRIFLSREGPFLYPIRALAMRYVIFVYEYSTINPAESP